MAIQAPLGDNASQNAWSDEITYQLNDILDTGGASSTSNVTVAGWTPRSIPSDNFIFRQAPNEGVWPVSTPKVVSTLFTDGDVTVDVDITFSINTSGEMTASHEVSALDSSLTVEYRPVSQMSSTVISITVTHSSGAASSYDVFALPTSANGADAINWALAYKIPAADLTTDPTLWAEHREGSNFANGGGTIKALVPTVFRGGVALSQAEHDVLSYMWTRNGDATFTPTSVLNGQSTIRRVLLILADDLENEGTTTDQFLCEISNI